VGSFERVFQQINLGDLQGNRFSVALRFIPIEVSNKQIESQVDVV
jgi:tRNA(Glu) U13 pseudouridine synthase TruD